jgi:hypothetical protein
VNIKFKINKHLKIRNPKFKLKTRMNNIKNIKMNALLLHSRMLLSQFLKRSSVFEREKEKGKDKYGWTWVIVVHGKESKDP